MNAPLIDKLTNDLTTCCPVCPYRTFGQVTVLSFLAGGVLLLAIGLRTDLGEAYLRLFPYFKSGVFAMIGFGALLSVCRAGLPGRQTGMTGPVLMGLGISGLVAALGLAVLDAPDVETLIGHIGRQTKLSCLVSVMVLGTVLLLGILATLRFKMAITRPALAGWLAGTAGGSFAAASYAWHCTVDLPLFIGIWYTIPVIVLGGVGLVLGPRILKF